MFQIPIDRNCCEPIYLQIVEHVTALARTGQLQPGERLPASRTLAEQLQVHRSTVINAYDELRARGLIETRQGSGSYLVSVLPDPPATQRPLLAPVPAQPADLIADLWRQARSDGVISLALGLPADDLMPLEAFARAQERVLRRDGARAMHYEEVQGHYGLRLAIAADLARHGIVADADEVVVTAGAQEGISLVARALASAGDYALVENPSFFGTLFNLVRLGHQVLGFDLGGEGPDFGSLAAQLDAAPARARFALVSPEHQNPTGLCWSMPERHQFLRVAAERDLAVVEDATYQDLALEGAPNLPLRALDREVTHIGSFAKSLMPGLRVGYVLARGQLRDHLVLEKTITRGPDGSLTQRTLAEFLRTGEYDAHLGRVLPVYRARRDAMLHALAKYFPAEATWTVPSGGLYIWVSLDRSLPSEVFYRRALERGISVAPSMIFHPYAPFANAFRLCYARYPADVLVHAVRMLGDVLCSLSGRGT